MKVQQCKIGHFRIDELTKNQTIYMKGMGNNSVNPFEWPLVKFEQKKKGS